MASQRTEEQATLPETGSWGIDGTHSTVRFAVIHNAVALFRAGFRPVAGTFDAAERSLIGEVRVEDVQVPLDILHAHLQREEFFDAANHPTIAFRSTRLEGLHGHLVLEGDLTIKGTTRPVFTIGSYTAPELVKNRDGSEVPRFGIELGVKIDRRDFDVSFNNDLPSGVANLGWEVTIDVSLELVEADVG